MASENKRKSVLFISHDATPTGAPLLLLNFLKWCKNNAEFPFEVLIKNCSGARGQLRRDFQAVAPVRFLRGDDILHGKADRLFTYLRCLSRWDKNGNHLLDRFQMSDEMGLIYSNTVTNGAVLEALSRYNRPIITHVHELQQAIHDFTGFENFELVKKYTNHYIAVSDAVKSNLILNHGIPPDRIDVVYGFVPDELKYRVVDGKGAIALKERLGIPLDATVVGASGTIDWRKGPDLFIHLARKVLRETQGTHTYFIWVGGRPEGQAFAHLIYDIRNAGLENAVRIVGNVENPWDYFAIIDIFVLTSREDPFPLVCLESASLGKPIICFAGAGGESEFVENDCGFVVPYLDLDEMTEKTLELIRNQALRMRLGHSAQKKVWERHAASVALPKLLHIIDRFLQFRPGQVPVKTP